MSIDGDLLEELMMLLDILAEQEKEKAMLDELSAELKRLDRAMTKLILWVDERGQTEKN